MRTIKINTHEEVDDRNKAIIQINWRHGKFISRTDGPAIVVWSEHRTDGPATSTFFADTSTWVYRSYRLY